MWGSGYHICMYVLSRPPASSLCLNYQTVDGKVLNFLSTRFTSIIPLWPPIHDLYNNTRCVLHTHICPSFTCIHTRNIVPFNLSSKIPIILGDFESSSLVCSFQQFDSISLMLHQQKLVSCLLFIHLLFTTFPSPSIPNVYMFAVTKCEHLCVRSRTTSPFRLKCTFDAN